MKAKAITFRCSQAQYDRMEAFIKALPTPMTRTAVLCTALEEFLDSTKEKKIHAMDLFEPVDHPDHTGSAPRFSEQARSPHTMREDNSRYTNAQNAVEPC